MYFHQTYSSIYTIIHTYSFKSVIFFPYFGPIHIFDFLRLLAISSRYCPFPRATVQFLVLLSISSCYCPVPRSTVHFPSATAQYAPTWTNLKNKKMGPKISTFKKIVTRVVLGTKLYHISGLFKGLFQGPSYHCYRSFCAECSSDHHCR